jgi:hypothetical protein
VSRWAAPPSPPRTACATCPPATPPRALSVKHPLASPPPIARRAAPHHARAPHRARALGRPRKLSLHSIQGRRQRHSRSLRGRAGLGLAAARLRHDAAPPAPFRACAAPLPLCPCLLGKRGPRRRRTRRRRAQSAPWRASTSRIGPRRGQHQAGLPAPSRHCLLQPGRRRFATTSHPCRLLVPWPANVEIFWTSAVRAEHSGISLRPNSAAHGRCGVSGGPSLAF